MMMLALKYVGLTIRFVSGFLENVGKRETHSIPFIYLFTHSRLMKFYEYLRGNKSYSIANS